MTRRESTLRLGALAVVVCASIGWPLGLAELTGSLSIPHNDAWSHARIAQTYADTGHVTLVGWNRSSLVGQVVVLGPLAASITAQHLFAAACGAVSLVMTYLLVRPRAGAKSAVLAALTLGVVPEFGLLTTSFMTDVPALAGVLTCLWAGDVAIRHNSLRWWWFSIVVGVWAVTVREQAIVGPVTVLLTAWVTRRPAPRHRVVAALAMTGVLVGFQVWRRSLPGDDPPQFEGVSGHAIAIVAIQGLVTVGLFLLPILAAVANPVRWRLSTGGLTAGAVLVLAAAATALDLRGSLLLGNYLGRQVSYGAASLGAPSVVPGELWGAVLIAAVVGTILLIGHVLEHGLPKDPLLLTAGGLLLAGTLAQAALGQAVFSRYLLLFVPIGAGLLLRRRAAPGGREPILRLGLAAAVVPLALGTVLTAATYSYDGARWAAAEALVADGVPPQDIDAGLEWVGTHAAGPVVPNLPPNGPAGGWYVRLFQDSRACYLITGAPVPAVEADRTYAYASYGVGGSQNLHVYMNRC